MLAAWLSGLSLAVLALLAAITAFLGWRRSSLFREEFPSLSIELSQEPIWADREWTLLVLTARLKNTSRVLVKIEAVRWKMGLLSPTMADMLELAASPEPPISLSDFYLEPQEEDVISAKLWIPTPEKSQPAYAELVVHCPARENRSRRGWGRHIYFLLEEYNA